MNNYKPMFNRQVTRSVLPVLLKSSTPDALHQIDLLRKCQPLYNIAQRFCSCKKKKSIKDKMFRKWEPCPLQNEKITIAGTGQVGMAAAIVCLAKRLTNNLVLFDKRKDWADAESLDLLHGSVFFGNPKIEISTDGKATKDSKIIVLTVGARPKQGGNRLDLTKVNADIMKQIVPPLAKLSPDAIFIVASNPADVMTYVTLKASKFPKERVISSSCHLDTARFRYFIGRRLGVAPTSVHGYIIGEHGASCVPVWSSVNVGGVLLRKYNKDIGTERDPENWAEIHQKVIGGALSVSKTKGYTSWAVGATIVDVIAAIQNNRNHVLSLGINAKGYQCVDKDIVMALPCVIGGNGIKSIINLKLTMWEKERLKKSADILLKAQELTGI